MKKEKIKLYVAGLDGEPEFLAEDWGTISSDNREAILPYRPHEFLFAEYRGARRKVTGKVDVSTINPNRMMLITE